MDTLRSWISVVASLVALLVAIKVFHENSDIALETQEHRVLAEFMDDWQQDYLRIQWEEEIHRRLEDSPLMRLLAHGRLTERPSAREERAILANLYYFYLREAQNHLDQISDQELDYIWKEPDDAKAAQRLSKLLASGYYLHKFDSWDAGKQFYLAKAAAPAQHDRVQLLFQSIESSSPAKTAQQSRRTRMNIDPISFYQSVIGSGAILAGFCGTFLAFRIQREANYYRQPAVSFEHGMAKDVGIGLTRFTAPMLLLMLATLCSVVFGFLLPLFGIAGSTRILNSVSLVAAGLVAALILLGSYFGAELIHYRVLSPQLIAHVREWKKEGIVVVVGACLAVFGGAITAYVLR